MLRIAFLLVAFLVLASVAVALVVSVLTVLALMCLVGIPLWMLAKPPMQRHGMVAPKRHPIERLQALYAEGKIDMFEFERRIESLLAVES